MEQSKVLVISDIRGVNLRAACSAKRIRAVLIVHVDQLQKVRTGVATKRGSTTGWEERLVFKNLVPDHTDKTVTFEVYSAGSKQDHVVGKAVYVPKIDMTSSSEVALKIEKPYGKVGGLLEFIATIYEASDYEEEEEEEGIQQYIPVIESPENGKRSKCPKCKKLVTFYGCKCKGKRN